jgi:hypothetical protein
MSALLTHYVHCICLYLSTISEYRSNIFSDELQEVFCLGSDFLVYLLPSEFKGDQRSN